MQTHFSLAQLADPDVKEADSILRACVHCGFCTATCPTYVLLGDEADGPRGRIYLIKDMLENDRPATAEVARHVDRCLSCLACMTTCPSGVNYMHLVDHARRRVEESYSRPFFDRVLRWLLAAVVPYPARFRLVLRVAALARPVAALLRGRLRAMVDLAPARLSARSKVDAPGVAVAAGETRRRVALLTGCAQRVLAPQINEATVRLLTRHGCEVVIAEEAGCCGALTHHMGKAESARSSARANIAAWTREIEDGGLDAIVINASGCGTTVKDYGHMFRDDPAWAAPAARVSSLARDICEVAAELDLCFDPAIADGMRVAYHAACSLQHGQRVTDAPAHLLSEAGFTVRTPVEAHLCCGSAGTYNMLQPAIARRLRDRKAAALTALAPDAIASGNIGCQIQIAGAVRVPVVHTVELLDWATGGPCPTAMARREGEGGR